MLMVTNIRAQRRECGVRRDVRFSQANTMESIVIVILALVGTRQTAIHRAKHFAARKCFPNQKRSCWSISYIRYDRNSIWHCMHTRKRLCTQMDSPSKWSSATAINFRLNWFVFVFLFLFVQDDFPIIGEFCKTLRRSHRKLFSAKRARDFVQEVWPICWDTLHRVAVQTMRTTLRKFHSSSQWKFRATHFIRPPNQLMALCVNAGLEYERCVCFWRSNNLLKWIVWAKLRFVLKFTDPI